jgi:hypothetical protein
VKNVQFYGAVADGATLNNAAFAAAVASGEVIIDTPGIYLLDGVNKPWDINKAGCVVRVTVSGVVFKVKPNNQSRYYICRVSGTDCDCDFGDATFLGDRDSHSWTYDPDGKWHEHGYGIFVSGLRNRVVARYDDANPYGLAKITKCIGDGIGVKGSGHEIAGFDCDGNRRQGLSAFDCSDTKIHNNTFQNTGPYAGVPDPLGLIGPFAGMDVEPDRGNVTNLKVFNNRIANNRKSGFVVWVRSEVLAKIEVEFFGNLVVGNSNGAHLKDAKVRPSTIVAFFHNNTWVNNSAHDIRADQGSIVTVGTPDRAMANIFDDLREREDRWRQGIVSPEIGKYLSAKVNSDGWNQYV